MMYSKLHKRTKCDSRIENATVIFELSHVLSHSKMLKFKHLQQLATVATVNSTPTREEKSKTHIKMSGKHCRDYRTITKLTGVMDSGNPHNLTEAMR